MSSERALDQRPRSVVGRQQARPDGRAQVGRDAFRRDRVGERGDVAQGRRDDEAAQVRRRAGAHPGDRVRHVHRGEGGVGRAAG
jgi:hypothetical protein